MCVQATLGVVQDRSRKDWNLLIVSTLSSCMIHMNDGRHTCGDRPPTNIQNWRKDVQFAQILPLQSATELTNFKKTAIMDFWDINAKEELQVE